MGPRDRDARRVNLGVAGIGEKRAALVRPPRRRDVRVHGIGRQVVGRAVSAGAEQHGMTRVSFDLAGDQVADDDAARLAVHEHEVEHLAARETLHRALVDLPHHRLVGAEQQLLSGLAAGVERPRHLRAAERPVVEQPAVLARERHALRHALVDDVDAQLRQPIDVGLARSVVAALDRVVEQPLDAVAVVLIVLRRVDAALRRDAVRAPRTVLDAEAQDVVAKLAQRRRGRRPREARADDDHRVLAPVCGIDQLRLEAMAIPFLGEGAGRNFGVENHKVCSLAAELRRPASELIAES